jgi:hypothetical protein
MTPSPSTQRRGDVHSPTNLVPEDYEYLFAWDNQQPGCLLGIAQSEAWREWHANGPATPDANSSQCTHCGAHLRYVALLRYIPTGQYLYVGETCLDNRFERSSADFHTLRKAAQLDREKQRLLTAWNDYKAENAHVDWDLLATSENGFIKNVLAKGRQYGNLSDKQRDAIVKAYDRDVNRVINEAAWALIPTVPVPTGKGLTITGKLVSRKWKETDFGSVEKCLVVVTTPEGEYKVWGSIPAALYGTTEGLEVTGAVEVGDTVTFRASVEASSDDPSFGFYKRPTRASIVAKGEVQA